VLRLLFRCSFSLGGAANVDHSIWYCHDPDISLFVPLISSSGFRMGPWERIGISHAFRTRQIRMRYFSGSPTAPKIPAWLAFALCHSVLINMAAVLNHTWKVSLLLHLWREKRESGTEFRRELHLTASNKDLFWLFLDHIYRRLIVYGPRICLRRL